MVKIRSFQEIVGLVRRFAALGTAATTAAVAFAGCATSSFPDLYADDLDVE